MNHTCLYFEYVSFKIKRYAGAISILFLAHTLLIPPLNAQDMTEERAMEYVRDNLDANLVSFIEEDGETILESSYLSYEYSAPVSKLDKESITIDDKDYGNDLVIIKCKKKQDYVKMSPQEVTPRSECVTKQENKIGKNNGIGIPPTSSVLISVSFGNTASAEGAKKALNYLLSIKGGSNLESKHRSSNKVSKNEGVIEAESIGGVFRTEVSLNGVVNIDMIIDSGASEVSISPDVASTIIRSGTVEEDDWLDSKTYVFADGSRAKSKRFNLDTIKIGNHTIRNVAVSISNDIESPLLLGQNVLSRLGEVTFDYENSRIIIE